MKVKWNQILKHFLEIRLNLLFCSFCYPFAIKLLSIYETDLKIAIVIALILIHFAIIYLVYLISCSCLKLMFIIYHGISFNSS